MQQEFFDTKENLKCKLDQIIFFKKKKNNEKKITRFV